MRYIVFYFAGKWHIAKRDIYEVYHSMAESDNRENAKEICNLLNMIEDIT